MIALQELDVVARAAVFVVVALIVLVWGAVDGQLHRPGQSTAMFRLQALGMIGFGAVALLGLAVDPDLGRYLVAVHRAADPQGRSWKASFCDDEWPRIFRRHRQVIQRALGNSVRVAHIGSTVVPGLAAKPIIDVQISVEDVEDEQTYLPALAAVGYALRVRQRQHRMFRTPTLGAHVHVCSRGGEWERRHLLFRDWLGTDHRDRSAYEAVKRTLAERDWETMNHYAAAKNEFIITAVERAEAWAQRTGWRP